VSDQVNAGGEMWTSDGIGVQRNAENYCVGFLFSWNGCPNQFTVMARREWLKFIYDLFNDALNISDHTPSKDSKIRCHNAVSLTTLSKAFFKSSSPHIEIYCFLFQFLICILFF
jgi:hypothetical protein